jgi:hypothetical protein
MVTEVHQPPPPLNVYLRPELHKDALLGLPGEIATRLANDTGADPAAILLTTLTMIGNAAGPEPHVVFGGGALHSARLMTVIVGDAAAGRKGTAVNAAQRLFEAADPRWAGRIKEGLKSPEAMIALVHDHGSDTRLCIVEVEFARFAGTMARTEFSPRLRAAWDGSVLDNTTKDPKRSFRASHAHVSMIGMITPHELERHHQRLSQGGGLESRLLYCVSAPDTTDSDPFAAESPDHSDLIDRLRMTLNLSRSSVLERADPMSRELFLVRGSGWQPSAVLPIEKEVKVKAAWRSLVRDRLPRSDDTGIADLWVRGEDQVVRLAAAYAIGTASDTIAAEHVAAAVAVWKYCAESAEILFGIGAGQGGEVDRAARRKVLDHLRRADGEGWVSSTVLNKVVFQGNAPRGGVARVLGWLTDKGHIEHRASRTRGRTKQDYRIARPGVGTEKTE